MQDDRTKNQTTSSPDATHDKEKQDAEKENDSGSEKEAGNVLKAGPSFEKGGLEITVDGTDISLQIMKMILSTQAYHRTEIFHSRLITECLRKRNQ